MTVGHTQKPGRMHNLLAAGFILLAAVCFLEGAKEPWEQQKIQRAYESVAEAADASGDDGRERVWRSPIDFEALSAMNPDTVGWIRIPDTKIDYPIVQGSDNQAYLYKSFQGEEADAGCIFLDFESRSDLRGYNNVLYGHNMKNGTMFADLVQYKDERYFREHPYFKIYTPKETICLRAVACYYIEDDSRARTTVFQDQEAFEAFVREMLSPCPYAEMPGKPVRNLYTLITCSYEAEDARTLLFAVEADGVW